MGPVAHSSDYWLECGSSPKLPSNPCSSVQIRGEFHARVSVVCHKHRKVAHALRTFGGVEKSSAHFWALRSVFFWLSYGLE
jgi:hypothetical protein